MVGRGNRGDNMLMEGLGVELYSAEFSNEVGVDIRDGTYRYLLQ